MTRAVEQVTLSYPTIGSKCWLLQKKGIYVLERGPGVLRGIACTHAGSGTLSVIDGLPDEHGFFHEQEELAATQGFSPETSEFNGRVLFHANPAVMGMWMLDGGFKYGLTLIAEGGTEAAAVIATFTWLPYLGEL